MKQLTFLEEETKIQKNKMPVILSASRMTDMPKYYPEELIEEVEKRLHKGLAIHKLVLWSKHPGSLLANPLFDYLISLKEKNIQLFLHCTITGLGKLYIDPSSDLLLEPQSPAPNKALSDLKQVIAILGSPLRVRLRIDPLLHLENVKTKTRFSNIGLIEPVLQEAAEMGIKNYSYSFLEKDIYKKVDNRFKHTDWRIIPFLLSEKKKVLERFAQLEKELDINIYSCSVEGLKESRCIDGAYLADIHPLRSPARQDEQRRRKLCACTHSIDLGGWPPKRCFTGCLYCYANPQITV